MSESVESYNQRAYDEQRQHGRLDTEEAPGSRIKATTLL